jgi:hypothetical protein
MSFRSCGLVLVAGLAATVPLQAQFATEVTAYNAGTGAAAGYTNLTAVLGEPSRITPGQFGGPVDPFAPAYTRDQLLGLGSGGSLTVRFASPIADDPVNPFGLDFTIFGAAGFMVTNAFDANFNYIGTPATDGLLFNGNSGSTRVSVSSDGVSFFTLDPGRAPTVDHYFPTDGSGRFEQPLDPALTPSSFAGLSLDQVRIRYGGAAGGASYDVAWAQTAGGQPANLSSIQYVRIDVVSGRAEIDGLAAVGAVPEPATWALFGVGLSAMLIWPRLRRGA